MKKLLLVIISLWCVNVYAEKECTNSQVENGLDALKNVTYSLKYSENELDMNGEFQEGYFKMTVENLPDGYFLIVPVHDKRIMIKKNLGSVSVNGGVYNLIFYSTECPNPIKTYEIKVPFYKQYCSGDECKEDIWFDGTYINNSKNLVPNEPKTSIPLILAVVSLVLIIVIGVFIFIKKRRHKNEGNL